MKRKLFVTLLVAILALAMVSPSFASACGNNNTNYNRARTIVSLANAQITSLIITAQLTPYDDVNWLVRATEAVVRTATKQVQKLGYDVRCEYKPYYVDGRWVMIDPIHIINPLPEGGNDNKPKPTGKE